MTKTALLSRKAPSELAGIEDESIAAAFNVECADMLNQWEQEREIERMHILVGSQFTGLVPGPSSKPPTVDRW